jgi:3-methyladenine DNA glycosylase AlkD
MYPDYLPKLRTWARSRNRWMRRASAVSLVVPARRGEFLDEIFGIADILLLDRDDMVQKGYGWMLKEASKLHRQQVYAYVFRNRGVMPRTALRYAIELMPDSLRKRAMAKSPAGKTSSTRR